MQLNKFRQIGSSHYLQKWDPEDLNWEKENRLLANKNLIFSIFSEHVGFSVWLLWSIIVINLRDGAFHLTDNQLFWLVAIPNLVGAMARIPYAQAVAIVGGRNWTIISSLLLLIPCVLLAYGVGNANLPYPVLLIMAATAGLGGGMFASSMANINLFYPARDKGLALGLNAAGGNLGVSSVQFLAPILIASGNLQTPAWVYGSAALLAALFAWLFMDNIEINRSTAKSSASALVNKHTWIMSLLYIGTFGSFIGFSAAMPLLIRTQFPGIAVAQFAFLGGFVGAVFRPLGGWLSDKIGGARITSCCFLAMAIGVLFEVWAIGLRDFPMFLFVFLFLFAFAGIGNGSTFRMIPTIFQQINLNDITPDDANLPKLLEKSRLDSNFAIGIISAIGALGGFLIPSLYGCFGILAAFCTFCCFYIICLTINCYFYDFKPSTKAETNSLFCEKI